MARAPYLGYKPNILIVRTDDSPIDAWGPQGSPLFDANWRSEFISFPNAVCNIALCCPTRVAGLTGLMVQRHGVNTNVDGAKLDSDNTFLEALRTRGYYTGVIGKWLNANEENESAFAQNDRLGADERYVFWGDPDYFTYTRVEDNSHGPGTLVPYGNAEADYCTDVEGQNVLDIMAAARTAVKPYCIYWAPKCSHQGAGGDPIPAPRHEGISINIDDTPAYGLDPVDFNSPEWMVEEAEDWPDYEQDLIRQHKEALRCHRSLDEWLDDIFNDMDLNNELDNTVIILTTDNMHEYGGMRLDGKGTNRREASGMDMLVRAPDGVGGGTTRNQAIADFDIAPTICALAGANMKQSPDGGNFWPCVEDEDYQFRAGVPLWSDRGGVRYVGFWDNNGYSSAVGVDTTLGQRWGWSDFYMTENVGPEENAMGEVETIIYGRRLFTAP